MRDAEEMWERTNKKCNTGDFYGSPLFNLVMGRLIKERLRMGKHITRLACYLRYEKRIPHTKQNPREKYTVWKELTIRHKYIRTNCEYVFSL